MNDRNAGDRIGDGQVTDAPIPGENIAGENIAGDNFASENTVGNKIADGVEAIGNDVYPLPVLIYGRPACEDTARVRAILRDLRVSFVEVDVDSDEIAARYVERINHGERKTPTIVFGDEDFIIVDPTDFELLQALRRAGYEV